MNQIERLQYAVIGKFTFEWADLDELRKIIPQQCEVKGSCQIGLFRSKHILIRLSKEEDFVNLISKGVFYLTCKDGYSYLMCTLIYDSKFKVNEETSMVMAWIPFPNLLPTFFVKECLFYLASVVGKPIQLDQATINKTRPSCAQVKVLVDLKGTFLKSMHINIEDEDIGEIRTNVVDIRYDYAPKYCGECKMQGHDKHNCRVINQCDSNLRLNLWEELYSISIGMDRPWLIGGVLVDTADIDDFKTCIEFCDLSQVPFKGSPFTWWNGRARDDCIFERLDRILVNAGCRIFLLS
ncbi:hypothetical protein R3W88_000847 [Solanum pinnatisectum]|uniref:DUF4283 domain-containing protein n=1 Tax=Solanum pinnatisectum TaxID=50273 RepID=A0AAV9MJV0_9SOLN|nr:hypothetical protein R3W88_000847 [Solanum pinnatisectum]